MRRHLLWAVASGAIVLLQACAVDDEPFRLAAPDAGSGAGGSGTDASAGGPGSGGGVATGGADSGGTAGATGGSAGAGGISGATGGAGGTGTGATVGSAGATGGTGSAGAGGATGSGGAETGGTGGVLSCPNASGVSNMVLIGAATPFCMDSVEVSNAQYNTFLTAGGYPPESSNCTGNNTLANLAPQTTGSCPVFKPVGDPNLPVSCVDWCDADAYCTAVGKRLCGKIGGGSSSQLVSATDSEWYHACSTNGTQQFPYGNFYSANTCNGVDSSGAGRADVGSMFSCVGGYPGIFDMSGNVREWENGCVGSNCPERGGGYLDTQSPSSANNLTCQSANLVPRNSVSALRGFRCCAAPTAL